MDNGLFYETIEHQILFNNPNYWNYMVENVGNCFLGMLSIYSVVGNRIFVILSEWFFKN